MPGVRSRSHSTLPRKCSRTPAAPLSMNAIITTLSTLRLAALSVKAHQRNDDDSCADEAQRRKLPEPVGVLQQK